MEKDTLIIKNICCEETEDIINEFTDRTLEEDILYMRDITNDEAELDEFYLITSGKYAKKMRQLYSHFENELLELN